MAQVNFRIDDKVKQEADELFDRLGVSLSAAITIFLKQSISRRGFPFPIVEVVSNGADDSHFRYPDMGSERVVVEDDKVARQKAEMMKLMGAWKDERTTEEIVKDIEGHRTKGRKVDL